MSAPSGDVLSIATLAKLHGVRGEFKLRARPESVALLRRLADDAASLTLHLPESGDEFEVTFAHVRGHESAPIVAIDGVNTRDAAMEFRGARVLVAREHLPQLADDEYWLGDLAACVAYDSATGERVGPVTDAVDYPANIVLTVRDERASAAATLLVPLIEDAVPTVDVAARRIDLNLVFLSVDDAEDNADGAGQS